MSRRVFAIIEVDDDKAIAEDKGTGEYLEKEIERLKQNGIDLKHWLIADDDDTERWARYINYLIEWAFYHSDNMYADSSPVCYDEWCDNEDAERGSYD